MEATVEAVSDGRFVFDTSKRMAGAQGDLGPSALLVQGGVSVIVVSKPGQPMCAAKPSAELICSWFLVLAVSSVAPLESMTSTGPGPEPDANGHIQAQLTCQPDANVRHPMCGRDLSMSRSPLRVSSSLDRYFSVFSNGFSINV